MEQLLPYKLRVDTVDKQIITHICTHYSPKKWVYCTENVMGENPHSHYYLEMSKKTKIAMADYIRKHVGSGNRVYATAQCKEFEPVEYLAYLTKQGDYESHNIDLTKAIEYDEKVKQIIAEKKVQPKTQLDKIQLWSVEKGIEFSDVHSIIDTVIDYYKEQGILVRQFQIVSLVQTLSLKYLPDYRDQFKNDIYRVMFKI